ncbi:hypothetical protein [Galbibacter pacificus]|uniref:Uncharacterized protein n=1 Tax=Galbibacter pacificus TaxID=2996052 RepID=A0ABT6FR87_9FLAO|nr:hypothetical protein [Galbibacter pacificus]MDG3581753.1 hypothetical protein [Galbibacter pacificus]MDG3585773.1 hypothetical protein [Galbibacter pacificus]
MIKTKLYYSKEILDIYKESFKPVYYEKDIRVINSNYSDEINEFENSISNDYIIIDNGKIKEINSYFIQKRSNNNIVEYNFEINKITKYDKMVHEITNNYRVKILIPNKHELITFIHLKWYQYWKIKYDKKDTWLHRSKLIDKIVFTLIGSIITLLLTKFIIN